MSVLVLTQEALRAGVSEQLSGLALEARGFPAGAGSHLVSADELRGENGLRLSGVHHGLAGGRHPRVSQASWGPPSNSSTPSGLIWYGSIICSLEAPG